MVRDPWRELGVARGASESDIKVAYRKLARRYHPDTSKEPGAEESFKNVTEAYAILTQRDQYIGWLRHWHLERDAGLQRFMPPEKAAAPRAPAEGTETTTTPPAPGSVEERIAQMEAELRQKKARADAAARAAAEESANDPWAALFPDTRSLDSPMEELRAAREKTRTMVGTHLRPGDTATYEGRTYVVRRIEYTVDGKQKGELMLVRGSMVFSDARVGIGQGVHWADRRQVDLFLKTDSYQLAVQLQRLNAARELSDECAQEFARYLRRGERIRHAGRDYEVKEVGFGVSRENVLCSGTTVYRMRPADPTGGYRYAREAECDAFNAAYIELRSQVVKHAAARGVRVPAVSPQMMLRVSRSLAARLKRRGGLAL
jgi:hypothetical protein